MVNKINFGKRIIDALPIPTEGRVRYHDTGHRYLYLDAFPSGSRTFQYVRKIDGKMKFIKIGTYPDMTPTEARIEADKKSSEYSRGEPIGVKKSSRKNFADMFNDYLEKHLKPETRTWEEDLRRFNVYLPPIHTLTPKEITPQVARDFHKKLGKERGEVSANRIIELVSRTFNFAIHEGAYIPNPVAAVKMFKERSRERILDEVEIRRFFTALKTLTPDWQDFFQLALFSGARRANVQAMKWDNLDLERRIWTIPAKEFKTGDKTEIILSDPAIDILVRRLQKTKSEYVFPSCGKSGHIVEVKGVWAKLLKAAGISDFHMHDLRRTFGSYQAKTGASLPIIGKSLGHHGTGATAIYARMDMNPVRESVDKATAAMLKAANGGAKK